MSRMSGAQYQELMEALLDGFQTLDDLRQMVRYKLNRNLDAISLGDNLQAVVYKLIRAAESGGWTDQLVLAARAAQPSNSALAGFAQMYGYGVSTPNQQELERIIQKQNGFLEISEWRSRLGEIEYQVCRIEVLLNNGSYLYGTGFLISPSYLITNYHVLQPVIESEALRHNGNLYASPNQVVCRFDYKRIPGKPIIHNGTEFLLDTPDWLFDYSILGSNDLHTGTIEKEPAEDELDYAIVKLAGKPGKQPIGPANEAGPVWRNWINIANICEAVKAGDGLVIVQHPKHEPLKLGIETSAVLGWNSNRTRIRYTINTEHGSSGSPCFNMNWELVALHHAGDPDYSIHHDPVYNQGIPFQKIIKLLRSRGKLDALLSLM